MAQYNPLVPPQTEGDLLPYLNEELHRISQSFNPVVNGEWVIHYTMPPKYRSGTVLYLDGVGANPLGTGLEGLYRFGLDNQWHYIG